MVLNYLSDKQSKANLRYLRLQKVAVVANLKNILIASFLCKPFSL